MHPRFYRTRFHLITLLSCLYLALVPADFDRAAKDPKALEIVRLANQATTAARNVTYDYEWIGVGISRGRFVGQARLSQETNQGDSRLWASGQVLATAPGFEAYPDRFETSTDVASAYFIDHQNKVFDRASASGGDAHLKRVQGYLFLYHFVNPDPFKLILDHAESVEWQGTDRFDGVECDVIYVAAPAQMGGGESLWYFGQQDHLPRWWKSHGTVEGKFSSFEFAMRNLKTDVTFKDSDFALDAPKGYAERDSDQRQTQVGDEAPDWTLKGSEGESVRLRDLRGQVVVMDFWVTWCPACKALMPGVQKLHEDFEDRGVRVFGINVLESGDPAAHMKESGYTYPLLLAGEAVADLYKIAWQPAVVVIGADGRILFQGAGYQPDRNEKVRAAVEEGVSAMPTALPTRDPG